MVSRTGDFRDRKSSGCTVLRVSHETKLARLAQVGTMRCRSLHAVHTHGAALHVPLVCVCRTCVWCQGPEVTFPSLSESYMGCDPSIIETTSKATGIATDPWSPNPSPSRSSDCWACPVLT